MPLMARMESSGAKLESGTYPVRCIGIKTDHLDKSQFGTGDVYRLYLEADDAVEEDGVTPVQLDAIANKSLTAKSKMTRWLAAFGVPFEEGKTLDLEQIIGRHCLALVANRIGEQGGEFSRVEDLMPMPRSRPPAVAAPVEPQETRQDARADAQPNGEHYHPAAKHGEPVQEAGAASQAVLDYVDRLLYDLQIDATDMRSELGITERRLNAEDAKRAVKWLEEKKTGTRETAPA
jgi:hypothetical protein